MLDFISIILLVLAFVRGYRKGLVVAVFAVLGTVLGIICALKLSGALAAYLLSKGWVTSAWAQMLSYVILFIAVLWIVRLGARLIEQTIKAAMLGQLNRLLGGIVYAVLAAIVWSCCLWIADKAHLLTPEAIVASRTYPFIMPLAPWTFAHIGVVLPFAKTVFADLQHFFDSVNQHLPDHVGAH